jgi:hypothetical protein
MTYWYIHCLQTKAIPCDKNTPIISCGQIGIQMKWNSSLSIETGVPVRAASRLTAQLRSEKWFNIGVNSAIRAPIHYWRDCSVKIWDTSYPKQSLFNRKSHMHIKVSLLSEFKSHINLSPNDNFSKLEWLMLFLIVSRSLRLEVIRTF